MISATEAISSDVRCSASAFCACWEGGDRVAGGAWDDGVGRRDWRYAETSGKSSERCSIGFGGFSVRLESLERGRTDRDTLGVATVDCCTVLDEEASCWDVFDGVEGRVAVRVDDVHVAPWSWISWSER